ncbi:MAG: glutamine-hydrolyzing GMP synthase, partial [Nitrososphaeraceae archaeon]
MDKIVVLDFGSQYSHLICRRIREGNVYCELLPYNTPAKVIKEIDPKGIILSGGPASVYSKDSPKPDEKIFQMGFPILGICYGHQIIVNNFGGRVKRATDREYGHADLIIDDKTDLFSHMDDKIKCWMSHGDAVEKLPDGFKVLAHTKSSFSAAIGNQRRKFYGLQFHPEVVHTYKGIQVLKNFSHNISKAKPNWDMESFIEMTINYVRKTVRNDRVLCAVSGGIDSTTVAALLHKAIGDNLQCVFVNHGLLRRDEEKLVIQLFKDRLDIQVIYIDAVKQFLQRLERVNDPEEKRKIIGEEFANVFVDVGKKNGPFQWLAQGTLYPDVIESGISKGPAEI